jgi:hypothetical protein
MVPRQSSHQQAPNLIDETGTSLKSVLDFMSVRVAESNIPRRRKEHCVNTWNIEDGYSAQSIATNAQQRLQADQVSAN